MRWVANQACLPALRGYHRRHPSSSRSSGGSNANAELMHKDTDLLIVVTEFSFTDTPVSGTAAKEWKVKYGYRPMVCALYCKELAGFILIDIDMRRVVQAQDHRVLREQHLVTYQDS
jgi:hypothetical protein